MALPVKKSQVVVIPPSGAQVSAFAVYKNLIPGVKAFEDHNSVILNPSKKHKKKNRKLQVNSGLDGKINGGIKSPQKLNSLDQKYTPPSTSISVALTPSTPLLKQKKKRKQNQRELANSAHAKIPTTSSVIQFLESKAAQFNKDKEEKAGRKRKSTTDSAKVLPKKLPHIGNGFVEDSDVHVDVPKPKKKTKQNKAKSVLEPDADLGVTRKKRSKPGAGREPDDPVGPSEGQNNFKWLIHPTTVSDFFSNYWEKKPLLIKRTTSDYYGNLLSSAMLDTMLRRNIIRFGKNIDVTSYTNGERETHNPVGRAMPPVVWDYYANGCSIRLLNPQTYIESIWKLNSSLQDFVGTFVGANVYLTPANSQGFAPHWDDIEAFVLQLEGSKHWRVYEPLEKLPKASSGNLKEDIIGKPILDVTLKPGDLLYFPRGYIHQANALKEHSLHITISCYQNNSYSDFLKEYLPMALDHATMESVAHREGLPRDYLQFMGVAYADRQDLAEKRASFIQKIKKLATAIMDTNMIDFAADQMGKRVVWDSLPPFVENSEIHTTVSSDTNFTMTNGSIENRDDLDENKEIRILRANCVRLVIEDASLRLYYSTENSLEYHGEEAQYIEMLEEAGPAIEFLIAQFPKYTKIQDLPVDNENLKFQIASDLWEKGIVRTKV